MNDDGIDGEAATRRIVRGGRGHEGDARTVGTVFAREILLDRAPDGAVDLERLRRKAGQRAAFADLDRSVAKHAIDLRRVIVGEARVQDAGDAHDDLVPVAQLRFVEVVILAEHRVGFGAEQRGAAAGVGERLGAQRFFAQAREARGAGERLPPWRIGAVHEVQEADAMVRRRAHHRPARVDIGEREEQRPRHAFEVGRALDRALHRRGRRPRRGLLRAGCREGEREDGCEGKRQGKPGRAHCRTHQGISAASCRAAGRRDHPGGPRASVSCPIRTH